MDNDCIREFFNKLADGWDKNMEDASIQINTILDEISPMEGKAILDIGAGTGVLVPYFLERNVASITECDISSEMIAVNKAKNERLTNISFFTGDAASIAFPKIYDRIIIYNAFPHFANREKLISNLASHLKHDGKLIIAHSRTREELKQHHQNISSELYTLLSSAEELSKLFEKEFTDIKTQEEPFFMIVGTKA